MKAAVRWLNRAADRRQGLVVAMLSVASFSLAHTVNVLLRTEVPEIDESVAWAMEAGLVVGAIVAFLGGFVAWFYLSIGTYAIMQIRARELSASEVTRRVGVAFLFPLAGFAVSILVGTLGAPAIATVPYALSALYGLAVLAVALSETVGGRPVLAGVGVATPVVLAATVLALLVVVAAKLSPVEAGS